MTLPRCRCGRKPLTYAPGSPPTYAPGGILIAAGRPVEAWCQRCAAARGWLVAPTAAKAAAACPTPRSARKTAPAARP